MKNYMWCLAMTIALSAAAVLGVAVSWSWYFEPVPAAPVSFLVSASGRDETISCWTENGKQYYVFLPSYAELEQVQVRIESAAVCLDGRPLEDGMNCEGFSLNEPYELDMGNGPCSLEFVQSANTAAVYVQTESGTMDYIHGNKKNRETVSLAAYTPDGQLDYSSAGTAEITGRGNSTWKLIKKPYNILFSQPKELLGMAAGKKWCLLANHYDRTNLRSWLVYGLADQSGFQWSPDTVHVDLYLNGEYAGLYLLAEAVAVEENRVNLSEHGCLFNLEHASRLDFKEDYPFLTSFSRAVEVEYPDSPGTLRTQELFDAIHAMERAVAAPDGVDPEIGKHWTELIDVDSWARSYLVDEISGNFDSAVTSEYFYLDSDGDGAWRIWGGPVWDYDISLANPRHSILQNPRCFYASQPYIREFPSPWISALCQKSEFTARVKQLYRQEFLPVLEGYLSGGLEEKTDELSDASAMNGIRWQVDAAEAEEDMERVKEFLRERTGFLTSAWVDGTDYCSVLFAADLEAEYGMYAGADTTLEARAYRAVEYGERLSDMPLPEDLELYGTAWRIQGTDEVFNPDGPVTTDLILTAPRISAAEKAVRLVKDIGKLALPSLLIVLILVFTLVDIRRHRRKER